MEKNNTYSFFFKNLDGQKTYKTVTIVTIRPQTGHACNKSITVSLMLMNVCLL